MSDSDGRAEIRDLLLDSFSRVRGLVETVTDRLTAPIATYRPDPQANTIAWLVWHAARIQDDHLADVAGVEQAWTANGWYDRFGLPFAPGETGFAQRPSDVAAVTSSGELLAAYHADVDALSRRFAGNLEIADLGRIVDERWDPPVTLSVRLVSVVGDCLQHLGQAAYLRGIAERVTTSA